MQFVPVKPFDFLRVSATLTEISASTALSCHEVIATEMNTSKQMGMSKEMSMPKEISMSSHGGATLLTLSNYPLQVRLRTRNVSRGVLYRSQDACDAVECDVHR
jgi:hypothetical protein